MRGSPTPLSPEFVARLISLCDGTRTQTQVARELGVTKNVVGGKIGRMRKQGHVLKFAGDNPAKVMFAKPIVTPIIRTAAPSAFTNGCRWPAWPDRGPITHEYCGHAAEVGSSYCAEHQRRSSRGKYQHGVSL